MKGRGGKIEISFGTSTYFGTKVLVANIFSSTQTIIFCEDEVKLAFAYTMNYQATSSHYYHAHFISDQRPPTHPFAMLLEAFCVAFPFLLLPISLGLCGRRQIECSKVSSCTVFIRPSIAMYFRPTNPAETPSAKSDRRQSISTSPAGPIPSLNPLKSSRSVFICKF